MVYDERRDSIRDETDGLYYLGVALWYIYDGHRDSIIDGRVILFGCSSMVYI